MILRFATALFTSAMLLFTCQPLVARMIVPLLGGAPSVWIVCSLCFQALLLAGYAYAHVLGTRLRVRAQVAVQLALVLSVFLVLPVSVDEAFAGPITSAHPTLGSVILLLRTIGLPFFVLSTTSPLLQRWFAELGESDPYHLYAASNAGSMLALLGYPFLVEPLLAVSSQSRALEVGYALYTVLLAVCAVTTVTQKRTLRVDATPAPPAVRASQSNRPFLAAPRAHASRWPERVAWIALAFAPSSLLLGATEFITTDIASVPLLWVVPLAVYLASFIVAFAKRQPLSGRSWSKLLGAGAAIVAALMVYRPSRPTWLVAAAHVGVLFLGSVVCHRALATLRPHVSRLTEFYLLLSVGGVLGGMFNGLVAPAIFDDLLEYPLAIGLVCLGRVALSSDEMTSPSLRRDAMIGGAVALATLLVVGFGPAVGASVAVLHATLLSALVVALVWAARRPVRFAVALVGVMLAAMRSTSGAEVLFADRGFFGVIQVRNDPAQNVRALLYGRTVHAIQSLDPSERGVPLAHYHPSGPAGDVLSAGEGGARSVGVIGLGVGSLAAYAGRGDAWTFFELNPTVVEVAREHFAFLSDASTRATVEIDTGDARMRLRGGPPARFDALVLDAFSSDAIPVHLVTREAFAVYRRALRPGGLLLAHVSNEHLDLERVFAALAADAGMHALERVDGSVASSGGDPSRWIVVSDSSEAIVRVRRSHADWRDLTARPSQAVWTDDFANVLAVLR